MFRKSFVLLFASSALPGLVHGQGGTGDASPAVAPAAVSPVAAPVVPPTTLAPVAPPVAPPVQDNGTDTNDNNGPVAPPPTAATTAPTTNIAAPAQPPVADPSPVAASPVAPPSTAAPTAPTLFPTVGGTAAPTSGSTQSGTAAATEEGTVQVTSEDTDEGSMEASSTETPSVAPTTGTARSGADGLSTGGDNDDKKASGGQKFLFVLVAFGLAIAGGVFYLRRRARAKFGREATSDTSLQMARMSSSNQGGVDVTFEPYKDVDLDNTEII